MLEKMPLGGTVAERVTNQLRADILSRKIEAGSHITIKEISEHYGIGIMPVREAFRVLEGEHILEANPYKGATVARLDVKFASDTYQITCFLETLIALNAIEEITEDGCRRLSECNKKMMALVGKSDEDRRLYVEFNHEFHRIITEFNSNSRANELFWEQHNIINSMQFSRVHSSRRILRATEQHERIIEAFRTKNRALLREVTEQHSSTAMEDFINQIRKEI